MIAKILITKMLLRIKLRNRNLKIIFAGFVKITLTIYRFATNKYMKYKVEIQG